MLCRFNADHPQFLEATTILTQGASDTAEFLYKTTDYWYPEFERSLLWNDPTVGVQWPIQGQPQLAAKDAAAKTLAEAEVFD